MERKSHAVGSGVTFVLIHPTRFDTRVTNHTGTGAGIVPSTKSSKDNGFQGTSIYF